MSIGAFGFRVFTIRALAGCTFTTLYLICSTEFKQNSYDFFGREVERVVRWRVDKHWWNALSSTRWRHCGVSRRIFAPSVTSETSSSGEADPPAPRSYHRAAAGRSISLRPAQWIDDPWPVFRSGA